MRRTHALVYVVWALLEDVNGQHWGYELSKRSGVRSGVLYPLLHSMLEKGWLEDGWEDQARFGRVKRPPRRYYKVTDEGKLALRSILGEARKDERFRPVNLHAVRRKAG